MTPRFLSRMEPSPPIPGSPAAAPASGGGPFDLGDEPAYRAWRDAKLDGYPRVIEDLTVEIGDPARPGAEQLDTIAQACAKANMAAYRAPADTDKDAAVTLARCLGLERLDRTLNTADDRITELQVADGGAAADYIPYTNRPLSWHTDGYYNPPDAQVRGFLLHCRRPAASGGVNALLDPEIVYIRLRDRDPGLIATLMEADAMTIPANIVDGAELRGAETGPVFSVIGGRLHMRYTARRRHVAWKDDRRTETARQCLEEVLNGGDPYTFTCRLEAGQGLVCNNVLHNRSAFEDPADGGPGRLVYRARFLDRVAERRTTSVLE